MLHHIRSLFKNTSALDDNTATKNIRRRSKCAACAKNDLKLYSETTRPVFLIGVSKSPVCCNKPWHTGWAVRTAVPKGYWNYGYVQYSTVLYCTTYSIDSFILQEQVERSNDRYLPRIILS